METPTFNKYGYLRDVLTETYVKVGGQMFADAVGEMQLQLLRETDPEAAKTHEFMTKMLSSLGEDSQTLKKAAALVELLTELKEREDAEALKS